MYQGLTLPTRRTGSFDKPLFMRLDRMNASSSTGRREPEQPESEQSDLGQLESERLRSEPPEPEPPRSEQRESEQESPFLPPICNSSSQPLSKQSRSEVETVIGFHGRPIHSMILGSGKYSRSVLAQVVYWLLGLFSL
jgi:hypothetical protein